MLSVIPILVAGLSLSGTAGALWMFWAGRMEGAKSGTLTDSDLRSQAAASIAWALFLLFHAVLLLVLSQSRDVPSLLGVCASVVGGLTFLASWLALARTVSAERRLLAK